MNDASEVDPGVGVTQAATMRTWASMRSAWLLLVLPGAVLARIAAGNRLLYYVRPTTRPYVLAAAAVLVLLGAGVLLTSSASTRPALPRVAPLVLAPVVALLLVPPPAAGSLAGIPRAGPPTRSGGLRPLRGPDPVAISLSLVVQRAVWAPDSLHGHRLRVLGFVGRRGDSGFVLSRLTIVCCAADAQRDDIDVRLLHRRRGPPQWSPGQWLTVIGTFAGPSRADRFVPVLAATRVEAASAPSDPYD